MRLRWNDPLAAFSRRVWWAIRPLWLWRVARLLLRSAWVAGALSLAGWLWSGQAEAWPMWALGGLLVFVVVFGLLALWPLPVPRLVRRLDAGFRLRDQLSTAYEVARRGPQNYLEARLLAGADAALANTRRRLARKPHIPWTDLELALVLGTAAVAAYHWVAALAVPTAPTLPTASYEPLPAVQSEPPMLLPGVPASLQAAQMGSLSAGAVGTTDTSQPTLSDAASAQQILDQLAEALSQQSMTGSAGAALRQGDSEQAADELRRLAEVVESVGGESLEALAEALEEVAGSSGGASPEVAEALNQAAQDLRGGEGASEQGNEGAAAAALESLARTIEDLGATRQAEANPTSGGENGQNNTNVTQEGDAQVGGDNGGGNSSVQAAGDGSGQDASGAGNQTGRQEGGTGNVDDLQTSGEQVRLPPGQTTEAGSLRPPRVVVQPSQRRFTPYIHTQAAGTGGNESRDPLNIPWRLRSVIQRYFSPP